MANDDESKTGCQTLAHRNTSFRWQIHRKIMPRRSKMPSVRLGRKQRRRGFFIVRLVRRIRVRWLKLKHSCTLKRLKHFYFSLVKDLIEAGATLESVQQRIMMETYFTVPIMGLSVTAGI